MSLALDAINHYVATPTPASCPVIQLNSYDDATARAKLLGARCLNEFSLKAQNRLQIRRNDFLYKKARLYLPRRR